LGADRWLLREFARGRRAQGRRDQVARFNALEDELQRLLDSGVEAGFPTGLRLEVLSHHLSVSLLATRGVVLATTDRLVRIADEAGYLAAFLGWSETQAVAALLTGLYAPVGLRSRVTLATTPMGVAETVTLSAPRDSDVTRSAWGQGWRRNQRSLKDRQFIRLLLTLRDEGFTPPVTSGKRGVDVGLRSYWLRFQEAWNLSEFGRSAPYKDWTGPRKHFDMLRERGVLARAGFVRDVPAPQGSSDRGEPRLRPQSKPR
jgi:hypothetical protein